jgi:hypothetical protein
MIALLLTVVCVCDVTDRRMTVQCTGHCNAFKSYQNSLAIISLSSKINPFELLKEYECKLLSYSVLDQSL